MTCEEREPVIGAYIDGELDASGALELERHIETCADCARFMREIRSVHTALHRPELVHAMPRGLGAKVKAAAREAERGGSAKSTRWVSRPAFRLWSAQAAAALVAVAVLVFAVVVVHWKLGQPNEVHDSLIADQVVSSHIRSMMPGHLVDVASTDQHTVKPWFDGRIDYAPPVNDFRDQGYPLIGGRLDYVDNRPVSALVYGRNKHIVNLFVWPASASEPTVSAIHATSRQGYHVEYWNGAGMTFWAVSDVNPADLRTFCRLVYKASEPQES